MGLLSLASNLDETSVNPGLAFSNFILKHSIKCGAILEKTNADYYITDSIGFDGHSIICAVATADFWKGLCPEAKKIKKKKKNDNTLSPLLQLFSENLKDLLTNLSIYKNASNQILICNSNIDKAVTDDFDKIKSSEKHDNNIDKLNSLIKENTFVLKFILDFEEAAESFISSESKTNLDSTILKKAIFNECYNRIISIYNISDATKKTSDYQLKTVFIENKNYSIEMITNHLILNLREVLQDYAELTQIEYTGTANSYSETKDFLQAE